MTATHQTSPDSTLQHKHEKQSRPPRRTKRWAKRLGLFLLVVLIGGTSGYVGSWLQEEGGSLTSITSEFDGNTRLSDEEVDVSSVADSVAGSVVSIATEQTALGRMGVSVSEGAGTGIIISENGYVLTNKHVIEGAERVQVVRNNGVQYENVEVVGSDPLNDIAFLKINTRDSLPTAKIGDSSTVEIGQRVIAIGNSLGQYQNTVTSGIISGKGRPVQALASNNTVETLSDLLQTDAAINPGNSGGPLLNTSGQVIGINTAVAEDAEGIGFAIPIDSTKGIMAGVLEDGIVSRGVLGVSYLPITPDVVAEYNLDRRSGAYVFSESGSAVQAGGAADQAGIQDGDIIIRINESEVGEDGGVSSLIGEQRPGDTIRVIYIRDGEERSANVTLGEYSE
ncbi:trypsin-like serine protease [Candidatus Saccharibacteria bacterium]|nr:trypsin-like serine protease [Candidatus Saccharibacteria bacterium]